MWSRHIAKWEVIILPALLPSSLEARTVTFGEARVVAENWLQFIVQRDGHWAGTIDPFISEFTEFRLGDMLLGYHASVSPQGYIVVSTIGEFAPIKAYSTESNLDPDHETGMCDLLKDVLGARNEFLIEVFGGLDEVSLQTLHEFTRDENRRIWTYLTEGGPSLKSNVQSIQAGAAGPVGPLLRSLWNQGAPFNDDCPDLQCSGEFNHTAKVGCVPLAMAQIMRYYCWPPFFESQYYDWPNMLVNEANYVSKWFTDEDGVSWTQTQIDAVADLCYDAGRILGGINYACDKTSAFVCNDWYHDARDAFEDDFFYDTSDDEPDCEDRDDHSYYEWWSIIISEISVNRPIFYGIDHSDLDFHHVVVVDGYDDSGGGHMVHANYGWGDSPHTVWYELDYFDCNKQDTAYTRCEWDEEQMIRRIYPRNGMSEWCTGTLEAWGGTGTLHHYIYSDTYSNNLTIQGGARVQFLPGAWLICNGNSITIDGASPYETRFFSNGMATRGLKVAQGGQIWLKPNGSICVY